MIEAFTRDLVLTNDQLNKVSSLLLHEFNCGLSKETHNEASVKMYPTFVQNVPSGLEQGRFLALDLGGTNFRVLLINLEGDKFHMDNVIYPIPQKIMLGSGNQLFDHIADCLANFMEKEAMKGETLPLGFTFSFPCKQEGLTKARLVTWTKGFRCAGVEGEDVVKLLREAVLRKKINIDVVAVVNDTTGTLMSCAHKNRECRVGVIVGTGTNACYMEKIENVETWEEDQNGSKQVIINTEWGAFGDNGCLDFLCTRYDREVDKASLNTGKQIDGKHTYGNARRVLAEMNIFNATTDDLENVKLVCSRVSTRAAFLVSAAISCILNRMKRPHTTVGVDGSVYRYHPYFHDLMERKISELTAPDYKFDLMLSEDGSGRGAALVAAVAVQTSQ
ncbi:hexokinase type 2-like isoform X3 [Tachypleus tridentatus]|uniref:hexokinase type 2-like isoform X3 n=1 Tax=Tachypleus tridentatus TaxID=6853 RepID=UPI003FD44A83